MDKLVRVSRKPTTLSPSSICLKVVDEKPYQMNDYHNPKKKKIVLWWAHIIWTAHILECLFPLILKVRSRRGFACCFHKKTIIWVSTKLPHSLNWMNFYQERWAANPLFYQYAMCHVIKCLNPLFYQCAMCHVTNARETNKKITVKTEK